MNDIWVLFREGQDSVLIIGAFSAPANAIEYMERQQQVDVAWAPPRPGKWRWEMVTNGFRYVIERHEVKGPSPILYDRHADESAHGSW